MMLILLKTSDKKHAYTFQDVDIMVDTAHQKTLEKILVFLELKKVQNIKWKLDSNCS